MTSYVLLVCFQPSLQQPRLRRRQRNQRLLQVWSFCLDFHFICNRHVSNIYMLRKFEAAKVNFIGRMLFPVNYLLYCVRYYV